MISINNHTPLSQKILLLFSLFLLLFVSSATAAVYINNNQGMAASPLPFQIVINSTQGVDTTGGVLSALIYLDTPLKFLNGTVQFFITAGNGLNTTNVTISLNSTTTIAYTNVSTNSTFAGTSIFNITFITTSIADGNYSLNVSGRHDRTGGNVDDFFNMSWFGNNQSELNVTLIIDNTAPVGTYLGFADGSSVNSHSVNISVNFSELYPSTITFIFANTTTSNTTTLLFQNSERGNLSYNFSFYVFDGNYTYNVSVNDSVAQRTVLATRSILLDRTLPVSVFLAPTEANNTFRSFDGFILLNASIYDQNLTFVSNLANVTFGLRNSTYSNSTVLYLLSNFNANATNNTMNFSYVGLSRNSQYIYNVTIYDKAGNVNISEVRTITLDNTNPQTAYDLTMGVNNTFRTGASFILNATLNDLVPANITFTFVNSSGYRNGSVQYLLTSVANTTTNVTLNISFLSPNSQYLYNITVYDRAGNINTSETRTITLDNTNPTSVFLNGTEANNTFRTSNTIFINASVFDVHAANITFGFSNATYSNHTTLNLLSVGANATNTTMNFSYPGLNPNSVYTYNVTIYDRAGNVNISEIRTITLDNTNPVATMTSSSGAVATLGVDATMTCAQTDTNSINVSMTSTEKSGIQCTGTSSCTTTFNAISYTSPTFTCTTKDRASNTKTVSFTFDRIDPPTSGGNAGGGGGGGGGGSSSTTISSANAEQSITAPISTPEVREVTFTLSQAISGAKVDVKTTFTQPAGTPVLGGKAYAYFDVTTTGFTSTDVKKSQIKFAVPTTWLKDQGFTTADITLQVYRGGVWKALKTSAAGGDETSEFFTADTEGFSTFAIVAQKGTAALAPTTTETPETPPSTEQQAAAETAAASKGKWGWIAALVILAVIVVAFVVMKKKTHTKKR